MTPFIVSSFGLFVMGLFDGLFTTPSWQTFTVLAWGWAVAGGERQTITTYLWLTGATTVKHFSRFYDFLGGALLPGPLAAVGADHPLRGAVGARRSPDCDRGGRLDQEKGGAADRRRRPLPQRRGLGAPRISHVTRAQLCVGDHAGAGAAVARSQCQCPHRLVALPQRGAGAQAQAALSVAQCPGPGNRGLCRGPTPARQLRVLGDGGYATKECLQPVTGHGRRGLAHADHRQALCASAAAARPAPGLSPQERPLAGVTENA